MSAFIARSPAGGWINPHLSAGLDDFSGIVGWPAGQSSCPRAMVAARTGAFPVASHAPVRAGFKARGFSDDYYHRIHLSPRTIAMGNVASVQTSTLKVWNAYLEDKSLASVTGAIDGIELTAPGAIPMLFKALAEKAWSISVTPSGPASVDAELVWTFDGLAGLAVHLTATRIVAFPFTPDWSDGIRETLSWLTDVLVSKTAVEQRRGLRIAPRRGFEASVLVDGRERVLMDLMCATWGAKIWALPIWHDVQLLQNDVALGAKAIDCETAGYDFSAGGLAMLRGESAFVYEVVQIDAINATGVTLLHGTQRAWGAGTRLYPVRRAELAQQPELTRLTDRLSRGAVAFRCAEGCDWPEIAPATLYRGWPVLTVPPEETEDLTYSYARLQVARDNSTGLPITVDTAGVPLMIQGYRWLLENRAEAAAHRSLLYWLAGRRRAVWVPTFAEDIVLVADIQKDATSLDVENVGYTQAGVGLLGRQDIQIELATGTVYRRRITAAAVIDDATERLLLDATIPELIPVASVMRISFIALMRSDSDDDEIQHETDGAGITAAQTIFKGVRDEL